jgi:hypothetical protein
MLTHYGLFWSAADVLWSGTKAGPGHLRGRERVRLERQGRPTKLEIDNASEYSSWIGVYCLYRDSRLIYVGEAGLGKDTTLFSRLKAHRSDHLADRWDEFSWFGRAPAESRPTTDVIEAFAQLEAVLIAVTNPGFNKQNGTFAEAVQVFQVPHDRADGDIDTKLGRLMAKLDAIEAKLTPAPEPKKRGRKPKAAATD